MSDLALLIVRIGFVAVLWIFVFSIISVIRADLFGQKVVGRAAKAAAPTVVSAPVVPAPPSARVQQTGPVGAIPSRLVITQGDRAGVELALTGKEILIGRAASCDLLVDDEYASSQHAKLIQMNNDWLIQDLNSTNGTFLAGNRVGTPAVVKLNTPVRVGKTVFELRA